MSVLGALRAAYVATGMATGVLLPFIAPMLAGRGLSADGIGLLMALISLAVVLSMPLWGHLGDVVLGRRRALQAAVALAAGAALLFGAPIAVPVVAGALIVWYVTQSAFTALLDSITLNKLAASRASYGRFRLLQSFSYATASLAVGLVYARYGYGWAYPLFVLAGVALVASLVPLDKPRRPRAEVIGRSEGTGFRLRLGATAAALHTSPRLWGVLAAVVASSSAVLAANTFLPLRLHDLGASPAIIAASATASALAEVPVMLVGERLAHTLGLRGFFALGCLMYVLAMVSWIIISDPIALVVTRAATGFGYASLMVSSVLAVGALLPSDLQASGQTLRLAAVSCVAVLAYLGGGVLYQKAGYAALFGVAAFGPILGICLAWLWLPIRRDGTLVAARTAERQVELQSQ